MTAVEGDDNTGLCWYVQREKEGFKRVAPLTRPNSAAALRASSPMFDRSNHILPNNTASQESLSPDFRYQARPMTATGFGNTFSSQPGLNTFSRPSTSAGVRPGTASGLGAFHLGNRDLENTNRRETQTRPQTASAVVPRFVTTDRQVCRFHGYIETERPWDQNGPLGPSRIEPYVVRHVTILFYIYDGTIEIHEVREVNSGMWQGNFLKRQMVTKEDGTPVQLEDFAPGKSVRFVGQDFHITDADAFTRDYMKRELNVLLPPPVRPQTASQRSLSRSFAPGMDQRDKSHVLGSQFATGLGPSEATILHRDANNNTCSTDYLVTKQSLDKTNRFLKYGGKKLKFLCVEVGDVSPPFFPQSDTLFAERDARGEISREALRRQQAHGFVASDSVRKYALTYLLESNYVDLCQNSRATGQDEPRLLLKKGPLPLNWRDPKRGYYEASDLRCGEVIDVYGRYFLLVDCDDKTKRYCREEYGFEQQPLCLVPDEEHPVVQPIPMKGDGFLPIGSNEDTLATVYGMPRVQKDTVKASRNQGRVLNAKAVFVSGGPVDMSRSFLVTFYLEDDTLQIYEENRRNSGISGGSFLKRGRYINDVATQQHRQQVQQQLATNPSRTGELTTEQQLSLMEPKYFTPQDIYLGNVLAVNNFLFQIVEMDNLSLKFCESYPDEFPYSDTFRIVSEIMAKVLDNRIDLRPIFRRADTRNVGYLSQEAFIVSLDSLNLPLVDGLNDQELLTLIRRFQDKATVPAHLPSSGMNSGRQPSARSQDHHHHHHHHHHSGGKSDMALVLAALAGEGFGSGSHSRDENVFWYQEMCDLVSHLYFSQQHGGVTSPLNHQHTKDPMEALLLLCRSRTVQWRRVMRKDPLSDSVVQGKVTLQSLVAVLQKHGVPAALTQAVLTEVGRRYRVPDQEAKQILELVHRRHGADQSKRLLQNLGVENKIHPKSAAASLQKTTPAAHLAEADGVNPLLESLLQKNTTYSGSSANRIAELRKLRKKITSVLRHPPVKGQGVAIPDDDRTSVSRNQVGESPETIVIDYNRFCDDIYVCDWI